MIANYDAEGVADVMGLTDGEAAGQAPSGFAEERHSLGGYWPEPEEGAAGAGLSPLAIERAVESGLPRHVLRTVAARIAGRDKGKIAALEWGIVPKTTLDRRTTTLSPQESERTERVARLFVHARRALGSEDEAREFMLAQHPELDRRSPIEASRTDLGTRRVEQLLNALESGIVL